MRKAGRAATTPRTVLLRPGAVSDLGALLDIERRAFATNRLSRRSFRRALVSPTAALIVAARKGAVAGYALILFRSGSRSARLYSIAVARAFSGQGVGGALLAAAETAAAQRGCEAMRLEVSARNRKAFKLYCRWGYRGVARLPDYYDDGGSALRLERRLRD